MAIVLTLVREVMRIVCAYGPQSGKPDAEKIRFYDEMASEWAFESSSEIIVFLGGFHWICGIHSFTRMSSCSVCMSFVRLGHHDL